ncbi:MAG TPA: MFS transporter [Dehalococcoidia bacterium]|nr:MFS transporter [Dehalococcoidia bacterium]
MTEATPLHPGGFRGVLAASALRYRDFRVLWFSSIFGGAAYTGETVVLGWLLLDLTDSAFFVGLGVALRALPNFLLGIPGGALVDRFDRRLVIRFVGFGSGLSAGLLGILALADALTVGLILGMTFVSGALRSLSQTARQTYAFDIVGGSQVVGGLALMALSGRAGGIIGPLVAGILLAAAGAGEAYLMMSGCLFVSGLLLVLARTPGQAAPDARPPIWQGLKEFASELRNNSSLRALVVLTAAVEILGFSHQAVLPSLARDMLHVGAEGLGLLYAFTAVGGVIVFLKVTLGGELQNKGRSFLAVLLVFGVALVFLGVSGSLLVALLAILLVSAMAGLSDLLSQSLIQSAVANDLRGRAMGSWILAIGLGPVGHLQIGALAGLFGVTAALATNGSLLVVLAGLVLLTTKQIRRL